MKYTRQPWSRSEIILLVAVLGGLVWLLVPLMSSRMAAERVVPMNQVSSPSRPLSVEENPSRNDSSTAPESEAEQMLTWVNRGEGLGKFHACEAEEVKSTVWHVTLCVPDPDSLSKSERGLLKQGVGVQAFFVLKELEGRYPGRSFVVWIKWRETMSVTQYGFAFRGDRGNLLYNEMRAYQ